MRKGQLEEENEKRKEAFEKHKCNGCIWATWLNKNTVVFCGCPRTCVREKRNSAPPVE